MEFTQNPAALGGLVLGGVAILLLTMFWRQRSGVPTDGVTTLSRVFLVLLRITIGWHFLVEGLDKLHTPNWSSEPYLREASGPLAPKFREMAGDSVIERLTPVYDDKNNVVDLSPALVADWQRYLDAFATYYQLSADQSTAAQKKFEEAKAETLKWTKKPQSLLRPASVLPDLNVEADIPKRLEIYKDYQKLVKEIEDEKLPEFGKKYWADLKDNKSRAAKWRSEMKSELDAQTAAFKKSLNDLLSAEQKTQPPMPEPNRPIDWNRQLDLADNAVKYGLVAVGVGLILGCFTRLAALAGAVLLLMFFLAMPPLPYLPESPRAEGHYLYINKNIIEMLALLALAFLPTGKWAGVDGLLQFLCPWNYRSNTTAESAVDKRLRTASK